MIPHALIFEVTMRPRSQEISLFPRGSRNNPSSHRRDEPMRHKMSTVMIFITDGGQREISFSFYGQRFTHTLLPNHIGRVKILYCRHK